MDGIIGIISILGMLWLFGMFFEWLTPSRKNDDYKYSSTDYSSKSLSSNSSLSSSNKTSSPKSISVQPSKISSTPEKRISLVDGHSRVFQNYYINGQQYTFGFPKSDCPDQRVWIGMNKFEYERISKNEAQRRLKNKDLTSEVCRILGSGSYSKPKRIGGYSSGSSKNKYSRQRSTSGYGHCNNCGKKLRGDTSKRLCHACWKKAGRPGY